MEELYEWIDQVDAAIAELAREKHKYVDVADFPYLCSIVNDMLESSSAYYDNLPKQLGVSATLVKKFHKFLGRVSLQEARVFADRLRSHLKSMDQAFEEPEEEPELIAPIVTTKVFFPAVEWRSVPPDVKQQIAELSRILDDIVSKIRRSNNAPESQYLTEIERQQLIAVLKTALAVLQAPVVEKGLLLKARETLQGAAVKAATKVGEKEADAAMGWLAGQGVSWLSELIQRIFS